MPKVVFVTEKQELEVPAGANLRQEAIKAGLSLYPGVTQYLNCRGNGLCGTCKVLVKKGMENLSPKTTVEVQPGDASGHVAGRHRPRGRNALACQVQVNGDCSIETKPPFNWTGDNFWQKPYPNK
jgi:2Fe-2S ferredoxin